ncbi:protein SUPPRESSOR OF PHYA-105 1-like [Curcuma longa]|uniref:protein SUPPRESSOR OF PHYA-105 1-like n=1 Tax=Curcuma longa TaxID=136217 RepID=UPI003D9F9B20
MEGTTEATENTDTGIPNEASHIKNIESDQLPQQDNGKTLETPGPEVSQDSDWPEQLSLPQSPEMSLQTVSGREFCYNMVNRDRFQRLCTNSEPTNLALKVEELTLKNYKSPNLSLDGCSSSGKSSTMAHLWSNFKMVAGKAKEKTQNEYLQLGNKDAEGRAHLGLLDSSRPLPCMHFESKTLKITEKVEAADNHMILDDSHSRFSSPGSIQTKIFSASGFQQFFNRSFIKGKGLASRHQESQDAFVANVHKQNIMRLNTDSKGTSISSHKQGDVADSMCLLGGGIVARYEGISLREWLKLKCQRINNIERVQFFSQILDLVDACHCQGLVLQHLQPSYFLVMPLNQVKYIGSFIPQGQKDMLSVSVEKDVHHARCLGKRKMHIKQSKEPGDCLELKYQKLTDDNINACSRHSGFRGKDQSQEKGDISRSENFRSYLGGLTLDKLYTTHRASSCTISQQPMSEFLKLEEGWYASPEELHDRITSLSSNIYSLGVLFFELFCYSETWEVHCSAMSDIGVRILPSNFLSERPMEAGFCLWLLHPDPYSRPKLRDIILSDLVKENRELLTIDHSLALTEEEDAEADLLLQFLLLLKEKMEKQVGDLLTNLECIRTDLEKVDGGSLLKVKFSSGDKYLPSSLNCIPESYSHEKTIIHVDKLTRSPLSCLYKERFLKNIDQLENAYFVMRSKKEASGPNSATRTDTDVLKMRDRNYHVQRTSVPETEELGAFFDGLYKFARYNKFKVCGSLKNADSVHYANVICSLSFDRDEDYFATAGVSKKIKIFEFSSLLDDTVDIHYPLIEMTNRSKFSCVCWNSYIRNYLASTDYEGVVQLWDASTGQGLTKFIEHQKRAWSVDFSQVDPAKLASGGDDFSVKLWSTYEKNCIGTIRNVANVCCVQFSPYSSHLLSFGCANYRIYCFDLRNTRIPWCTLAGHGKAVSYVKFIDAETIVSASTDNSLKIWDLKQTNASRLQDSSCKLTLSGHTNEKNFVGLSVSDGYITCGSETNEVYAYYKTFPMPMVSHKFGSIDPITALETNDDGGQFVSSVCWRGKSNMVVAANSTGSMKVLHLV